MFNNIIEEIQSKKLEYRRQMGFNGKIVCLDAVSETKLAAFIVREFCRSKCFDEITIEKILQNGIRDLGLLVYGLQLQFDYSTFYISG